MRPHDAAYKRLFSFPDMVRDLLAGFVPGEWVRDLDLSTVERWPDSHVSDDLRERHQDRVWRVRFRERWLYVLVLLEFQSTVDRSMAVRILVYSGLLYQDLLRAAPAEALPPVLPVVLYHGAGRWTAPETVAGLAVPCGAHLAPYQPAQRYFLLDLGGYTGPVPEGRNLVAALLRLARTRDWEEIGALFNGVLGWLPGPEHEGLIQALWEWLVQVHLTAQGLPVELPRPKNWKEVGTVYNETVKDWWEKWHEEGRVEGRVEGLAEVVRRQAARKYGAGTAERLAGKLAEIADAERTVEVGEWLLECEDGGELLDRVERLRGAGAAGGGPSPG